MYWIKIMHLFAYTMTGSLETGRHEIMAHRRKHRFRNWSVYFAI